MWKRKKTLVAKISCPLRGQQWINVIRGQFTCSSSTLDICPCQLSQLTAETCLEKSNKKKPAHDPAVVVSCVVKWSRKINNAQMAVILTFRWSEGVSISVLRAREINSTENERKRNGQKGKQEFHKTQKLLLLLLLGKAPHGDTAPNMTWANNRGWRPQKLPGN